ncbi:Uncharacterised protein [Klebsiella pneumoniae]|nr:Uncharacterised protein [Klebsiella pneumoniae]
MELLKYQADFLGAKATAPLFIQRGGIGAIKKHLPFRRRIKARQNIHQRGFTRTRSAHNGDKFTLRNAQINVIQGGNVTEPFV